MKVHLKAVVNLAVPSITDEVTDKPVGIINLIVPEQVDAQSFLNDWVDVESFLITISPQGQEQDAMQRAMFGAWYHVGLNPKAKDTVEGMRRLFSSLAAEIQPRENQQRLATQPSHQPSPTPAAPAEVAATQPPVAPSDPEPSTETQPASYENKR